MYLGKLLVILNKLDFLQNAKVLANVFLGTRDKCMNCKKTVYPTERVTTN